MVVTFFDRDCKVQVLVLVQTTAPQVTTWHDRVYRNGLAAVPVHVRHLWVSSSYTRTRRGRRLKVLPQRHPTNSADKADKTKHPLHDTENNCPHMITLWHHLSPCPACSGITTRVFVQEAQRLVFGVSSRWLDGYAAEIFHDEEGASSILIIHRSRCELGHVSGLQARDATPVVGVIVVDQYSTRFVARGPRL